MVAKKAKNRGETLLRPAPVRIPLTHGPAQVYALWSAMIPEGGPMPETEREEPNEALVEIFESEQESEAMVVAGLLESAGIDVLRTSFDAPQDVLPVGGIALRVREDQAEEARAILAEYRNKGLSEAEAEAQG